MSQTNKKLDFSWGNPFFLLEILSRYIEFNPECPVDGLSYAPGEGIEDLVRRTKVTIKETTGMEYKHVIITAGATQAINSILRYKKMSGEETVVTPEYGYPYYEAMIKFSNLKRHTDWETKPKGNFFYLIDSPSNPLGQQRRMVKEYDRQRNEKIDIYWDAVYHNKIYGANLSVFPEHTAMIGSYSKILGVTGVRIGYIATNSDSTKKSILDVHLADTATVSIPSQKFIISVLSSVNLQSFMSEASVSLSYNKEEFQKIEHLFDGQEVPNIGMFYCVYAEEKSIKILEKCGIKYVDLKTTDERRLIRLSLGQTNTLTRDAVKLILKKDKVK